MAFYATATFTGANATNNAGIWKTSGGEPQLVARIGSNATGGGIFSALGEPVLDNLGRTTFIGSLRVGTGGVVTANATGIWRVSANGSTTLIARAGSEAPGAAGTLFSSFTNLVAGEGGIAFRATLASGSANVTAANNTGIWAQNASGNLVLVARLGSAPTPALGSFTVFNSETGQAGHARHFNNIGDLLLSARFGTGPLGIYMVDAFGFGFNGTAPIAAVGSPVPGVSGGLFSAISNPILSQSDEVAFRGTFTGNGVATGNNTAIFAYSANGSGRLVVRTGGADSGGRIFQTLSSPILNGAGNIAFTGTLRSGVGGVSTANATGVWTVSPDGPVAIVARAGDEAPGTGGARFATFPQISYPDEAGIAFTATLAGTGITTTNNTGLWASPSPGAPVELVLRTGDSFLVGGVAKTVSTFSAYAASAATAGAGRGFNAFGDVVFLVTFSDGTRGIFKFEMP